MSLTYPSIVDRFLSGDFDVATAVFKVQLLGAYVVDEAHSVRADLTHTIGSAATATYDHHSAGAVYLDALTVPSVASGSTVLAVGLYIDDGATKPLVSYMDRRADRVLIELATNGGNVDVSWPGAAFTL